MLYKAMIKNGLLLHEYETNIFGETVKCLDNRTRNVKVKWSTRQE